MACRWTLRLIRRFSERADQAGCGRSQNTSRFNQRSAATLPPRCRAVSTCRSWQGRCGCFEKTDGIVAGNPCPLGGGSRTGVLVECDTDSGFGGSSASRFLIRALARTIACRSVIAIAFEARRAGRGSIVRSSPASHGRARDDRSELYSAALQRVGM